jgi:CRP/FNR family transcriptional regulator, cyclic AMP receptor protein
MSESGLLGVFGGHAFLNGLGPRHLMLLASGVKSVRFGAGDYLGRDGETAKAFYLIQSGHVALEMHARDRGAVPVQTVGPGEVVGWSWLVAPHCWRFDCRAVDAVQALAFDAEWLREKCDQDHELGYQLLKHLVTVMASRMTATWQQLLETSK